MAQDVDIIDLRRSYIPVPPDAFPVTLHNTAGEDNPEARIPVIPYDGYNFMPTPQGYASFFGINTHVDIDSLYYQAAVEAAEATYGPSTFEDSDIEEVREFFIIQQGFTTWEEILEIYADGEPLSDQELADLYEEDSIMTFFYTYGDPDVEDEFGPIEDLGTPGPEITPAVEASDEVLGTTGGVDDLFMIQRVDRANKLVALCEDGIWVKHPGSTGAWTQEITLDIPDEHRQWSKCVIDNVIYAYRAGEEVLWIANPEDDYVFEEATPTGINMTGQLGIFKAGGRLGFWDSENSTGWGSLTEPLEFGNAEELSGFTIFQDIVGRIIVCLQHGDGFIIYCTKSIVRVRRNPGSQMLFQGSSVFNNNGISYRREACFADPDTTHFAFTTQGLVEIGPDQAQVILPEIATYFKEKREPVFLKMLNGRYLFFTFLNPYYAQGRLNYETELAAGSTLRFAGATRAIEGYDGTGSPCRAVSAIEREFRSYYLNSQFGYTANIQATDPSEVPIWSDYLSSLIPIATLNDWKTYTPGFFGDYIYFNDKFTEGGIVTIDTTTEYFIPEGMAVRTSPQTFNIEPNEQSFYDRQNFIWYAEQRFGNDWKTAIERKARAPITVVQPKIYRAANNPPDPRFTRGEPVRFGPYVDFSALSEANRYYGAAEKSAWLQRSLTRLINVKIQDQVQHSYNNAAVMPWIATKVAVTIGTWATYAQALAVGVEAVRAYEEAETIPPATVSIISTTPQVDGTGLYAIHIRLKNDSTEAQFDQSVYPYDPDSLVTDVRANVGAQYPVETALAQDVMRYDYSKTQTFLPSFETDGIDTCLVRELGYTRITGHGHYELDGSFVVDDSTPEAPDYEDICETDPRKNKKTKFNGFPIGDPWSQGMLCGQETEDLEIAGESYSYPEEVAEIPSGDILLQDGSDEPLYPLFIGAHVFDIQYKKWGKLFQDYKLLLDFFPINNVSGDAPIPYDTYLPRAACLLENGKIAIFDQFPDLSEIVFGKYGQNRKGYTDLHEVRIQHRDLFSGTVTVESSLNGRDIETSLSLVQAYTDTRIFNAGMSLSARWYNFIIEGNYDLIHLEARSSRAGRR